MKVSAYFGSHRDDPCSIASAMAKAMRLYDSQTCRSFKVARGSLAGVAAGTLVASFLTQTFVVPQYACRKAGINWWRYVIVIGGSGVVAGGLFASVCYGIQYLLPINNWLDFSIQISIVTLCYVPIALFLLVPQDDRIKLRTKISNLMPIKF